MQSGSRDCSHSVESRPADGAALRQGVPLGSRCHGSLVQFSFEFSRLLVPNGAQSISVIHSMLSLWRCASISRLLVPNGAQSISVIYSTLSLWRCASIHGCSFPTERSRYQSFNVKFRQRVLQHGDVLHHSDAIYSMDAQVWAASSQDGDVLHHSDELIQQIKI